MNCSDTDWIEKSRQADLHVRSFIAGRWQHSAALSEIAKYGPRDGQLLYRFSAATAREVDQAVMSARAAHEDGRWSRMTAQARKEALYRLAALLEKHRNEFALWETLDVGKPIRDAFYFDVPEAVATLRFSAEAADKFYSKVYAADPTSLSYELRRPMGVVAGLIGWNFPLLQATQKIGPVLAAGNCLVLKPSELTSLSAARVAALAIEAGIPEGVLNVVHGGAEVGSLLVRHPEVDLVTFTGSTRTGKELLVASGQSNMKRLILECGGKSPNIVFDDSPSIEAVAEAVVSGAFWNQGQVCAAGSRLLVHTSVKKKLLNAVIERTAKWISGDPLQADTTYGALVSDAHRKKVLGYVEAGEGEGATVAYRSRQASPCDGGFYLGPIVFDNVSPAQKVAQEEIFGPVLSVIEFRDEEEAIRMANSTIYGLTATLWTKDLVRMHRVTHAVKAGLIVVNASEKRAGGPTDQVLSVGGHKQSGLGAEGGVEGIEAYTSKTAVQVFV